ncbi:hypothetical protein FPV67DRAFT_1473532 [Lyophyllum atratum]|nr:hypothetical protein FPV67DRAFT_1473532 [Lyophyllum atratum]
MSASSTSRGPMTNMTTTTPSNTNAPTTRTRVPSSSSISAPTSPSPLPHTPSQHLPPLTPVPPSLPVSPPPSSPRPLDMKRLLAKPAPPYARAQNGSGSESESCGGGGGYSFSDGGGSSVNRVRRERERERVMSDRERDRALREISFDRGQPLDLDLTLEKPVGVGVERSRSRSRSEATHEKEKEKEGKEKRVRNVLRRRPSTTAVSSPSPSTTNINTTTKSKSMSRTSSATASPSHLNPDARDIRSPLPPLSPRSPLTPSILPAGSPASLSRATSPRPTTAPGPRSPGFGTPGEGKTRVEGNIRPVSRVAVPRDHQNAGHGYDSEGGTPYVRVTDVGGKDRGLRPTHAFPSPRSSSLSPSPSSSPAPSRTHSPSFRSPHRHPHHLSSASPSPGPGPSASAPASRSASHQRPEPDTGAGLTPANAIIAAYKRQAAMREAAASTDTDVGSVGRAAGGSFVSTSESAMSRLSFGGTGGGGFEVIERVVVRGQGQGQKVGRRPHTASGAAASQTLGGGRGKGRLGEGGGEGGGEGEGEGTGGPYYTVFGSTSGRVVAVGGPEDHHHLSWDMSPLALSSSLGSLGRRSTVAAATATSSGGGGGGGLRTLTRKVSGRWRRGASESEREETQRGVSLSVERGRPSLQERQLPNLKEERSGKGMTVAGSGSGRGDQRSLRLSIDKFPEEVRVLGRERERELERERERQRERESKSSPASGSPASGNTPSASPSTSGGGGSKIWKLMKRISTGGLREKYSHQDVRAPPVPALPKEYASPSRSPEGSATPRGPSSAQSPLSSSGATVPGRGKVVGKKASILGVNVTPGTPTKPLPSPTPLPRSPLPGQTTTPAVRPSPPTSNARPSTTTRSSSPNSSDVASARFFSGSGYKQSASAHSSASSLLFEAAPPMPKLNMGLAQHIIPPSELGRMHSDEGHGGSEESSHQRVQKQQRPSLQLHKSPSRAPSYGPSQSQAGSNKAFKKLKLVLPTSPSPTKQPRKSDDWMIVHTPAMELASLPLPPRRAPPQNRIRSDTNTPTPNTSWSGRSGGELDDDRGDEMEWERMWGGGEASGSMGERDGEEENGRGSPIIPSFSTADPINAFASRRVSTDTKRSRPSPASMSGPASAGSFFAPQLHRHPPQLQDLQNYSPTGPPPRPRRSTQRPPPGGSKSVPTSPVNSSSIVTRIPVPPYATAMPAAGPSNVIPNPNRRSTGGHSTASTATITNIRRRSSSWISVSPPSPPPRRVMTFRELGHTGPGTTLSEQEKAARWDDLLDRSAKAGGTLHLDMAGRSGEDGLKSDRLRFSEISEVTSL